MKSEPPPPSDLDVLADNPRASLTARTQMLVAVSAVGWFFFSVRALITRDYPFSGATGLAALLTLIVLALVRARPEWARQLAHVNAAIATIFILVSCLLTGQVLSASLPYLVCIPLAVGYLQGIRNAAIWAGIAVVTAVFNEVLMRVMPLRPTYVNSTLDFTIATIVLIFLTLGLVAGSERVHGAHIEALRKREVTIEALMLGLEKKSAEAEQERDRAIDASKAKGEFVATLSHEIRTPLNGVLGMASLLLDDDLPPQQRELVRTIRTSGDALLGLLNDMLDFSKIEAGRIDLERAPFDLRDCVEDAFDLFAVSAANKHLRLAYLAPPAGVPALGDAGRIRQILVNLIGNAIKFTDQGEVIVEVLSTPARGGELHFTVRDTGIGIDPERIDALFEPFTQADVSTTRRYGGTGLGLAICRRLAQVMGGRAWVESRPGEGSTFHITLRLDPAPPAAAEPDTLDLAGHHIVIAATHDPTRRMLAAFITEYGAIVTACATADDARRALASGRVDAFIAEEACSPGGGGAYYEARLLSPWEPAPVSGKVLRAPVRHRDLRRLLLSFFHLAPVSQPTSLRVPPVERDDAPSVLVAEDNPVNQRVVRLMLERLGCRPDVAGTGREALDALRSRRYDVVLMDVRMPEMDGIEATRALRADLPAERQPFVVAMTANVQLEDRDACAQAGMDDFLSKPMRPADLARVLTAAKNRRQHPR